MVKLKNPSIETKVAKDPLYNPEEILGILPKDHKSPFDMREVIARVVDDSYFFEFKKEYGNTLVTGFAHINGIPVGIIGNNGILFSDSSLKGTHFIELCTQERIPLVFLQNITGFMIGEKYEHEGIAKHGAKLVHAVANAAVPKITMVLGGVLVQVIMVCAVEPSTPTFFMYPNAKISVMGGEQAAHVLTTVKEQQLQRRGETFAESDRVKIQDKIRAKYAKEGHAYYSSARLWDDGVINPCHTRRYLAQALSASLFHDWNETRYGTFRM